MEREKTEAAIEAILFAMGNAVSDLKSMADVVVSSNNHDGVAEAVRYLISAVPPAEF